MTIRTLLLAGACAGLLAFGAAPGLAAGPLMPGAAEQAVNGNAAQKAEYRGDRWRNRWSGHVGPRRHFHSPRYGHGYWRHRNYYSPRYGHPHRGYRHYNPPRYRYWNNYHSPYRGNLGHWRW
jgi:hypothetical protein